MPGFLHHLALSEQVLRERPDIQDVGATDFLLGCLIPDLAVNRDDSHYRGVLHVGGWKVPGLSLAKRDLLNKPDTLLLGCYCHLWFDHYFVMYHLAKQFICTSDAGNEHVIDARNGKLWSLSDFLSPKGLYGAYDCGNRLLIDDHLMPEDFWNLPKDAPKTGLNNFDKRITDNWMDIAEPYLSVKDPEDNGIYTPEELETILMMAKDYFLKEIRYIKF